MANVVRTIRKFFVSGFVVFTFVAYALHERVVHSTAPVSGSGPEQTAIALVVPSPTQLVPATPVPSATEIPVPATVVPVPTTTETLVPTAPEVAPTTAVASPTDAPVPTPTAVPVPTDTPAPTTAPQVAGSQYKDGEYTGSVADAYYGNLQVKAVIQKGKIANVEFLDYPHDRRTSQRINSQAMPYLQEEAIQVQNANVDIISGATLTSQAFVESLQAALNSAKS
ncbi:MAG: FMN-binding protein [Herpetosiphonaceae bacterium]|nr:FMN-binding protein [Herpetosiphonaceae bacterium]